jgi:hypothetical protein
MLILIQPMRGNLSGKSKSGRRPDGFDGGDLVVANEDEVVGTVEEEYLILADGEQFRVIDFVFFSACRHNTEWAKRITIQ